MKSIGSLTEGDNPNLNLVSASTSAEKGKNEKNEKSLDKKEEHENENIPLASVTQINNVSDRVFNRITVGYKIILGLSLSFYMIYCIIFFVIVLLGCKRLGYLVNYCEVNNERNKSICNRETIPCLIVLFYPFFIRFTQCINRYYYTRQKWPHLGNTFKYVGGLSNAICAWLYSR